MAIYMADAVDLVPKIMQAIMDNKIVTWVSTGRGFTCKNTDQWDGKALLQPLYKNYKLVFGIIMPKKEKDSNIIYAIYHGRFIEMLLSHFNSDFTKVEATSKMVPDIDILE